MGDLAEMAVRIGVVMVVVAAVVAAVEMAAGRESEG